MEIQEIGEILELNYRTVKSRIREAVTQGYIVGPQLRKKSFMNFITYEYLVNCEDRKVVVSEKCVKAFEEYFESLPDSDKQAVFLSRRGRRISRNQVYTLIKKYGRLAGIQKNVTPHVLRHTLATNMIAHGASIIEVKEQLGHRSLESTLQYVHLQIDHRKTLYEAHCPQF